MRAAVSPGLLLASLLLVACATVGPVYPARPPATEAEPVADPDPSRVVVHATITRDGLVQSLDGGFPRSGKGSFSALGSERSYYWRRGKPTVRFADGRVGIAMPVEAEVSLPLTNVKVPFDLTLWAEPVLSSEYVARFQRVEVKVTSDDRAVRVADALGGVLDTIRDELQHKLEDFSFDARPVVAEAHGNLVTPMPLPLGDASGCAEVRVLAVEAGPTVLADGIEKDFALVLLPSVVMPCAAEAGPPSPLPPLSNVASIPSGPFTVTASVVTRYEELAKAMGLVFTDGKYFFSKQYPEAYMEKPEVYYAKDKLVLKLRIGGPVSKLGFDEMLDGDIYFAGTPTVVDNELRIPDLEPTVETSSFLLKMKSAIDGEAIRDQARAAMRLDIGQRLAAVKEKLGQDLRVGGPDGCARAEVTKVAVTGVHPHGSYLRVYVAATGVARVEVPCLAP